MSPALWLVWALALASLLWQVGRLPWVWVAVSLARALLSRLSGVLVVIYTKTGGQDE